MSMLLVVRVGSSRVWSVLVLHWLLVKVHHLSGTRRNDGHWHTVVVVGMLSKVAMAMLPLQIADRVAGILALYSDEVGFFDEEELKLLD